MNTGFTPILNLPPKFTSLHAKNTPSGAGGNFADHLKSLSRESVSDRKNLLGVRRPTEQNFPDKEASGVNSVADDKHDSQVDARNQTELDLLINYLQEIQGVIDENESKQSENWVTPVASDPELIRNIGIFSKMSDQEISNLITSANEQGGGLPLGKTLSYLIAHLKSLDAKGPNTVPETHLPMLQTLMMKMGADADKVAGLTGKAVSGDDKLNISALVEALKSVDSPGMTVLSQWEIDQLDQLLVDAGVSGANRDELLPENFVNRIHPFSEQQETRMTLLRLRNILLQGIQEAESSKAVDIEKLASSLNELFTGTGTANDASEWMPVVSKAVDTIYKTLLRKVDLSTVASNDTSNSTPIDENFSTEAAVGKDAEKLLGHGEARNALLGNGKGNNETVAGNQAVRNHNDLASGTDENTDQELESELALETGGRRDKTEEPLLYGLRSSSRDPETKSAGIIRTSQTDNPFMSGFNNNIDGQDGDFAPIVERASARIPAEIAQRTFDAISQGVMRSLNSGEHQLVMRLHPRELGEVRVEMMIRDEQVAVSFSIDNSKVKDILEGSMNQFRENLAKQGFVLGECMVSVKDQGQGQETWQQFAKARNALNNSRVSMRAAASDIPNMFARENSSEGHSGIDLFA